LSVVAGTTDLSKEGSRHNIEYFKINENYQELNTSDIAIMKVTEPFVFTDKIGPITYSTNHVGGGVRCLLTGWGYTFPIRIGGTPRKLQRANFTTLTNEQCTQRGMQPTRTEICVFDRILKGACGVSFTINYHIQQILPWASYLFEG
jgi:Trypsin